jgi:hypothetical protein
MRRLAILFLMSPIYLGCTQKSSLSHVTKVPVATPGVDVVPPSPGIPRQYGLPRHRFELAQVPNPIPHAAIVYRVLRGEMDDNAVREFSIRHAASIVVTDPVFHMVSLETEELSFRLWIRDGRFTVFQKKGVAPLQTARLPEGAREAAIAVLKRLESMPDDDGWETVEGLTYNGYGVSFRRRLDGLVVTGPGNALVVTFDKVTGAFSEASVIWPEVDEWRTMPLMSLDEAVAHFKAGSGFRSDDDGVFDSVGLFYCAEVQPEFFVPCYRFRGRRLNAEGQVETTGGELLAVPDAFISTKAAAPLSDPLDQSLWKSRRK